MFIKNTLEDQITQLKELKDKMKLYPEMHKDVEISCTSQPSQLTTCDSSVDAIKNEIVQFVRLHLK